MQFSFIVIAFCLHRWEDLHWRREVFLALLRLYERLVVFGYLPARQNLLEDYTALEVEVCRLLPCTSEWRHCL